MLLIYLYTVQLYRSLEAGKWLPEEDFEMTEFSAAVTVSIHLIGIDVLTT